MRVDRVFAADVLSRFRRKPMVGFRITTLLSSCVRYAVLLHRLGGPALLAEEIREAGKLPIIEALAGLGWQTLVPVRYDLGGVEVRDVVEGVRGDAVAVVTIGRPTAIVRKRLLAIAAMLNAKKEYLISADPITGAVSAYVFTPTHAQKRDILEYLRHRAQIINHYINANALPPPDEGPWCAKCPYQLTCHALNAVNTVKEVGAHA